MTVLDILIAPHATLKAKAKKVAEVDSDLAAFLDDMLETMYAAPGIGLAANQVGDLRRVFVMDCSARDEAAQPYKLVNPQIIWTSEEVTTYEEGCLSLPELYGDVERPAEVKVRYLDENGKQQERHFVGIEATCAQHELDHLNGKLFIDHLSALKRSMLTKKMIKAKKDRVQG